MVVLADGQTASAEDLIEHCRSHIASYKKPVIVEFVDELPRQGWAIDYDALDERFGGGGYPGDGERPLTGRAGPPHRRRRRETP